MAHQKSAANAMEIDRLATQLAMDPHSKAFLPLAEEYCKAAMWEEAVSVLEEGLRHYPGFITAMVVLGRAYDQLNQSTKARAVLEGAVKLSPENLRAHRTLIKIYAAQGLKEDALKSCRVILTMNPKDEEALSVQASLGVQEAETKKPTSMARRPSRSKEVKPKVGTPIVSTSFSHTTDSENPTFGVVPQEDRQISEQVASVHPEASGKMESSPHHAETIAQLKSWLRSLQRQRRDRPTSETAELEP